MKRQFDKRPSKPRNRKPVLVIMGEGANVTELQYFSHFNKQNGKYSIQPHRAGHVTDPVGLVKDAEKYWEDNQLANELGDKIYIFIDIDCNQDRIRKIREAKKASKNVKFIFSNPTFEIWYLLHFEYTTRAFQNGTELIQMLKKKYIPEYEKSLDVSAILEPNLDVAIMRAKQLKKFHEKNKIDWPSIDCNPMTDVFELVEEIQSSIRN